MQKVERLLSIIMILLKKEVVSASEFSQLFQVTKRTIQRDVEALSYANIPIYAKHGPSGGYALMEEYKFDKRLVNQKDIEHILVALDGFEQLTTNSDIQLTIQKIKGMSPTNLASKMDVTFYQSIGRSETNEELSYWMKAIEHHWLLAFDYVDQQGRISHRLVEPYKVQLREMHWYVVGFCLERNDFRTFKLTRITDMEKRGFFTPREQKMPQQQRTTQEPVKPSMTSVKIELDIRVRDQFIERFGREAVVKKTERTYSAIIPLPESPYAFQFLAGFGNKIKIIAPSHYRSHYTSFLKEALALYE
ncbi:helix-turn-helix transcriptional regulator [Shouchella lehensis]|uniref:YafY family transcriptional regulator n=1 Tax=Shouchella lehensis TaxID=300825 RepID=A0A4Y7WJ89_9BACI|nr:YafY family protein [Shouchella lehensis]MBG9785942.1 DNA-binding protein [Shouchella lehensis]TES48419.1 YafY family transcriptional regulator [Shouchella lehensis]